MKKRITLFLIVSLMVMMFSGCSSGGTSEVEPAVAVTDEKQEETFLGSEEETYYMIVMVSGVEYWAPVYETFKQAGNLLGVNTVFTGTPEYDVNKELAVFEQVLAKKPAGIFVHPMNADAFVEPINRAIEMGIPVVTFAADSPNSKRVAYITSDNSKEGSIAADAIAKDMGYKGEVGILENPGQDNHDRRVKAFIDRIESEYPDMEVVARAATNQDPNKAYQALLTMAQAHPDLQAVFMPEASSGMGAAQAAVELGTGIRVMCVDVNASVLDMIKSGDIWGAICPDQGMQGYFGMLSVFSAAHADRIDPMSDYLATGENPVQIPFIDNGLTVVTKDNADYFYLDKYLERTGSKGVEE